MLAALLLIADLLSLLLCSSAGSDGALPVLNWYTNTLESALTVQGSRGNKLVFLDQVYEDVAVERRGQSSLSWPKPKLKFSLPSGVAFKYSEHFLPVTVFGLQSHYFELGERSYMKDNLGVKVLEESGVPVSNTFHIEVRVNDEFFGMFSFVEMIDLTFLKRMSLSPPTGPLFKAEHPELANLRWDLQENELPDMFKLSYPRDSILSESGSGKDNYRSSAEWSNLARLTRGLGGGGRTLRSQFVIENLAIPSVINEMAAQAVINNMDRCTKNFFLYLNAKTEQWHRIPWDMDGSLGQSNGLGGVPGEVYAVLAQEQWNSPLYCDSEHTQDQQRVTAWGTVTVPMSWATQAAVQAAGRSGRRSLLQYVEPLPKPQPIESFLDDEMSFPTPDGWENPDKDFTKGRSPTGAPGTYNHLTDAVLDVSATREMYLRRLRTLTDKFLAPGGRLEQLARQTYDKIKKTAERDVEEWNTGIRVEAGYIQITQEFIPIRWHLLSRVYGPEGSNPLLPASQQSAYKGMLVVDSSGKVSAKSSGSTGKSQVAFIKVRNPSKSDAVDLSGWQLFSKQSEKKRLLFVFEPGTVLPARGQLYVAEDIAAFRSSGKGVRTMVVGLLPEWASEDINKVVVKLTDGGGTFVDQLNNEKK